MNTSWKYWENYLQQQEIKFAGDFNPTTLLIADDFVDFEISMMMMHDHKRINAAVRHFIKEGDWPDLRPMERYFCLIRIQFALRFLHLVRIKDGKSGSLVPERLKASTREQVLRWLLVAIWDDVGFAEWSAHLQRTHSELKGLAELEMVQFSQEHKLVQFRTRELPDRVSESGMKEYECYLKFENGDAYRATFHFIREPNMRSLLEHFRWCREFFDKV